jgi:hypothetical protein
LGAIERQKYITGLPGLLAPGGSFLLYAHLVDDPAAKVGLDESEIQELARILCPLSRVDSLDRFGRRAAWIELKRHET